MTTILRGIFRHTFLLLLCRDIVATLPRNKAFVALVIVIAGIVFYPDLLLSSVLFLTGIIINILSSRGVRYVYGLTLILAGISAIESVALMLGAPKAALLLTFSWFIVAAIFFYRHTYGTEYNE